MLAGLSEYTTMGAPNVTVPPPAVQAMHLQHPKTFNSRHCAITKSALPA